MSFVDNCLLYDPNQSILLQLKEIPGQRLCPKCWAGHIIAYKDNTIHFIPMQMRGKVFNFILRAEAEEVDRTIWKGFHKYNQKNTYIIQSQDGEINFTTDSYHNLDPIVKKIFNNLTNNLPKSP